MTSEDVHTVRHDPEVPCGAWLNNNWIPRATAAGLRHVALIQPSYYFNKVAVETVGANVDPSRLALSYFGDIASARAWLAAR